MGENKNSLSNQKSEKITTLYQKNIVSILKITSPTIFEFYKTELLNNYFEIWNQRIKNYEIGIYDHKENIQTFLEKSDLLIFRESIERITKIEQLKLIKLELRQTVRTLKKLNKFIIETKNSKSSIFF